MNLSSTIQIHQGHGDDIALEPDWTGTIESFWEANDGFTYGDVNDMKRELADYGYHRIGGGAAAAFTICTPEFAQTVAPRFRPDKD